MIELKIRRLNESITKVMFTNISRSLFEAHKKLYAFLICAAIKKEAKNISEKEWEFFVRGAGIRPKTFKEILPTPASVTPDNWYYAHKLMELKGLENIMADLKGGMDGYRHFFKGNDIFTAQFPGKEVIIINNFHLLLLSRALSP
jgi:dynein heavy chain, axonemal